MSFTPGPWEVNTEAGPHLREVFADSVLICDCGLVIDPGEPECEANARLIAAAPDLLEALTGLLADIQDYQRINQLGGEDNHWQVRARAAIAKAEAR